MNRFGARRVLARVRHGSSLPVVAETEGGKFLVKLRGAGHGLTALIAEIIVGSLAEALGLPVPERALVELDEAVPSDDRNDELADLLRASSGTNLGIRFLDGARELRADDRERIDEAFAVRLLWLDGLVMNPDRTPENPNVLIWKRQPWLIDHGAALAFQHDWASIDEDSPREPNGLERHLFADKQPELEALDATLARAIDRDLLARAIAQVPEAFLRDAFAGEDPARLRQAYLAFLWKRLKPPRPFLRMSAPGP